MSPKARGQLPLHDQGQSQAQGARQLPHQDDGQPAVQGTNQPKFQGQGHPQAHVLYENRRSEADHKNERFEDYHKCLFNEEIDVREHRVIKARLHNIHTEKENKIALNSNDDKKYLILGDID